MTLSETALVLIGLLLAAWTLGAGWLMLSARTAMRRAEGGRKAARRMARMIDEAPAIPMLVRADGRIEAPQRLAAWLGLEAVPGYLSELDAGDAGIEAGQLAELAEAVRVAQKTATPFRMAVTPRGSRRSLAMRGYLVDSQVAPGGAALVWVFDFSESEAELAELRAEAAHARDEFVALVGLIEAAPIPMWFRGPDARLRLVNSAYVRAVGASDPGSVIDHQIELIEAVDGLTAAQVADQARVRNKAIARDVSATIDGQRRTQRVSDMPLGEEGVAGYAIDVEELEEQDRALRAFRDAQRSMLDLLSVGVAQFDGKRRLAFANGPFLRIFALKPAMLIDAPDFEQWLAMARDNERLPELRDFPEWRREHVQWFAAGEPREEAWPLRDGTHLRIIAQPMPDGGLVLIAEDQTEHLALSATRDTLLRTRTATFDSLFESLAVFAPDGRMQIWNRRFAADWGLEEEFLDRHPRVEGLLEKIAVHLLQPEQIEAISGVVRAATLDRKQTNGEVALADGRILEFAGVPLPDGNGLLTVLDVTASRKAEEALRERNIALEEADAVKTRFLANMSYEFRTPLTSIGGFAELLESGIAGELSPQAREYVDGILSSVEKLGDQIETVLDLTQSEAGLLPLALEEVDMMPFVTKLVREREQRILDGGLSLNLRGNQAAGKVQADRRRLGRALGHILDNAITATPSGGRILIDVSPGKQGMQVVVSDNGEGMTVNQLAHALDGYRIAADGKGVVRRQGLGLPLAKQLIEAHGGRLELMSQKGVGTTATIILP
ncbi:putative two-component histidine kinase [Caenibius tardaugens NBRC 16725]|uniref:histidine kinase n=1 Tax=Caenibius tardaugens NBRC 16725 TaxID=1219035 RepID=U2YJM2_9SPHN|nr:PAS domain-containing sensor histidine kinase [Caenibius tardaugens]AZI34860.1 PAS domain-containing protein [Caenibius tardaugens NBRC 16725]GAD48387.1 putative two-component histidine kinase [Caenibius tardaugens NBRC 16725]